MSFRYKITLTIFLLAATVILTVVLLSQNFLHKKLVQQITNSQTVLMDVVKQHSAVEAIITEDYGLLQYELEEFVAQSTVQAAALISTDGLILSSSDSSYIGENFEDNLAGLDWRRSPIMGASGFLGEIAYVPNSEVFEQAISDARRFGLMISLIGLSVIAACGLLFGSLLARRIEKIARETDHISRGDLHKFEIDESKDEIGTLSRFIYELGGKISNQMSELMDSQDRLNMAVDAADAGTWRWAAMDGKIYWSSKIYKMLGCLPSQLKPSYNAWLASVHPDDREMFEDAFNNLQVDHEELDIEYRIVRPSGALRWMRIVGRTGFDYEDNPTVFYGLQIDISRYKKLEGTDKQNQSE